MNQAQVEEQGDMAVITSPNAGPSKLPSKGTIAVDMDDVLCQTNQRIVDIHNSIWNTQPPLTLADFKYYLYWRNRGWGDEKETIQMVAKLYESGVLYDAPPVPGAKEAIQKLKDMGYNIIIITARSESARETSEDWLAEHMPDLIDEIHFTGAFQHLFPTKEEVEGHAARKAVVSHKKRSKAEVVHQTKALFLVDDSAENAVDASVADPPIHVLLFGQYPWNAIVPRPSNIKSKVGTTASSATTTTTTTTPGQQAGLTDEDDEKWTYKEKERRGVLQLSEGRRKRLIEESWMPEGVERVKDWDSVVRWVEQKEQSGWDGVAQHHL